MRGLETAMQNATRAKGGAQSGTHGSGS